MKSATPIPEEPKMKKQDTKPKVAPPASYKAPSLPTLAVLGIITASATLTTGCTGERVLWPDGRPSWSEERRVIYMGLPYIPEDIPLPEERPPANIPEGGVVVIDIPEHE